MITQHVETICPGCGYRLDASGNLEGRRPRRGDISICFRCGMPLIYDDDALHMRKLTTLEIETLTPEEQAELMRYIETQQQMTGGKA